MKRILLTTAALGILAGCATAPERCPIIDREAVPYDKFGEAVALPTCSSMPAPRPWTAFYDEDTDTVTDWTPYDNADFPPVPDSDGEGPSGDGPSDDGGPTDGGPSGGGGPDTPDDSGSDDDGDSKGGESKSNASNHASERAGNNNDKGGRSRDTSRNSNKGTHGNRSP